MNKDAKQVLQISLIAFVVLAKSMVLTAATLYVNLNNPSPAAPYTSWDSAATNIQDAIDAATDGDLVLVTNGVYETGGRAVPLPTFTLTNRVVVDKAIILQSVNGPGVTVIRGYQIPGSTNGTSAIRCVYLTNGAVLAGFTLTRGATQNQLEYGVWVCGGGGVFALETAIISNCVLTLNSGNHGAGAFGGTLDNCILTANSAASGGGAYLSTLNNCTLTANSGSLAFGGAESCTLNNCIVYYNASANFTTQCYDCTVNHCCTIPLPQSLPPWWPVLESFTNAPLFVDQTNGDFHLQPASPCINAGRNALVATTTDFDGNPRIVGGTVDVGAYEFQSPASAISYAWLQQYGLPTDGTADALDSDHDSLSNWQEWIAGTNPTNAASVLRMDSATNADPGVAVSWLSVTNRSYFLERSSSLSGTPAFSLLQSNLAGLDGTTTFMDTSATGGGPFFYRIRVEQ